MISKKSLGLGLMCMVFVAGTAFAAPVRLPSNTGKTSAVLGEMAGGKVLIGLGGEYDYVNKMKLKESTELNYNSAAGLLSLTYDKKYSVYGSFGAVLDAEIKGTESNGLESKLGFDSAFMWGVGANGVIVEKDGYQLFADASYSTTGDMDINRMSLGNMIIAKDDFPGNLSFTGTFQEWQAALGVSKDFEWFKPYAGAKYSDTRFTMNITQYGESDSSYINNRNKFGAFVGATVTPVKGVGLNLQGRFIDETAVMGSATFQF